jgi:hypothetical protein
VDVVGVDAEPDVWNESRLRWVGQRAVDDGHSRQRNQWVEADLAEACKSIARLKVAPLYENIVMINNGWNPLDQISL